MSELLSLTGLAGSILCLAGVLPGTVGRWGPQSLALVGMTLMAASPTSVGLARMATALVAAACLWSYAISRRPIAEAIDLAAMTVLMALMTHSSSAVGPQPSMAAMSHGSSGPLAVLIVACWAVARSAGVLFRSMAGTGPKPGCRSAGPHRGPKACREAGALVMIASTAALLA